MQNFKVNEFISLRFEQERTNIYIKGEKFRQCKYLLLDVPLQEAQEVEDIVSIDEASELLGWTEEGQSNVVPDIPPEVEFWGHCSNLQAWAENNYDTRLLHSNIAFPLLSKLVYVGDPLARKVFKEEIGKRVRRGNLKTSYFLVSEQWFLDLLEKDEIDSLLLKNNPNLRKTLEMTEKSDKLRLSILLTLTMRYNDSIATDMLIEYLNEVYISGNLETIKELKREGFYDILNFKELKS